MRSAVSAYKIAIDQIITVINNRARYFRNLVVVVVAMSLGLLAWGLVTWSLSPLVGLLLLVPACGLFFFFDA